MFWRLLFRRPLFQRCAIMQTAESLAGPSKAELEARAANLTERRQTINFNRRYSAWWKHRATGA